MRLSFDVRGKKNERSLCYVRHYLWLFGVLALVLGLVVFCENPKLFPSRAAGAGVARVEKEGLREWFKGRDIEGLVFHHPDGRMAKIKKRDFGLKRKE